MQRNHSLTITSGFTLIEIVTVVAIIGILSAIAIPQIFRFKTSTYKVSAKSDITNFQTHMEARYSSYKDIGGDVNIQTGLIIIPQSAGKGAPVETFFASTNVYLSGKSGGTDSNGNTSTYSIVSHHYKTYTEFGKESNFNKICLLENNAYINTQIPVVPPDAPANLGSPSVFLAAGWLAE